MSLIQRPVAFIFIRTSSGAISGTGTSSWTSMWKLGPSFITMAALQVVGISNVAPLVVIFVVVLGTRGVYGKGLRDGCEEV